MSAIPGIALLIVLLVSSPGKQREKHATSYSKPPKIEYQSTRYKKVAKNKTPKSNLQPAPVVDAKPKLQKGQYDAQSAERDYKTIYQYITTRFKRVNDEDAKEIADSLVKYGKKHGLDPKFAAAVMARESGFNKKAVSPTGANGLGQIKSFNYPALKIKDPFDIEQNTQGTVKYLKTMLNIWKDKSEDVSLALASYYQGQGTVKKNKGQVDNTTKHYVQDIIKHYQKMKTLSKKT